MVFISFLVVLICLYSGGLEFLFDKQKKHQITVEKDANTVYDMRWLIKYLKEEKCRERVELFSQDESV